MSAKSLLDFKKYTKNVSAFLLMILGIFIFIGCANIFSGIGTDPSLEKSLIYDVQMLVGKGDWTTAIDKILSLPGDVQNRRQVQVLLASAYAGRCGQDVLNLSQNLSSPGGKRFFQTLFSAFAQTTASKRADCLAAYSTLNALGSTVGARTTEENYLMSFIGFSKFGALLNYRADADDKDDIVDATFLPCDAGTGATELPDADIREMVSALANSIQSLSVAAAGPTVSVLSTLTQTCALLVLIDPLYDFCSATDASAVTAKQITAIRRLLTEGVYVGLGIAPGDAGSFACPL